MAKIHMPPYEAKRSKDFPEFLLVWCQHEDCGERPFLVHARTWLRPRTYTHTKTTGTKEVITIVGRSCPYCFRAGLLPIRGSIR